MPRRKSLAPPRRRRVISAVAHVRPADAAPLRIWSLDVLRGVCAGVVFLSHWHLWSDFAPAGAFERLLRTTGGWLHDTVALLTWPTGGHHPAVIGFFVLSGFCIHYPFERRALAGGPPPDWSDYFRRRFLRIMPVYWAACLLGLAFVVLERSHPSGSLLLTLHGAGDAEDFLVRFIGLAGVWPREIFAGNYILTTVTVEILMYAAYPLFHRHAARGEWTRLGAAFLWLHLLSIGMLRWFTPYWVFNSIFMLGIFWHAGALAAHLFLTRRATVPGSWLIVAWLAFLALKATPHFTGLNLLKQAAWGVICALGILWVIAREPGHAALGESRGIRALRRLGDFSYSLYAVHTPAIMLATWALLHLGLRDYTIQLGATMAASLAATLGVHYGIEKRFYRPRGVPGS